MMHTYTCMNQVISSSQDIVHVHEEQVISFENSANETHSPIDTDVDHTLKSKSNEEKISKTESKQEWDFSWDLTENCAWFG